MVYNVHYCLDQIFVSSKSSDTCKLCGTKEKKDCCKSETKILKTDPAQNADIPFVPNTVLIAEVPSIFYADLSFSAFDRNECVIENNAPPIKPKVPLFISNCNFRI